MPIVDIESIDLPGSDAAQPLADALGEVFGSPPGTTWVRLRSLPREHYAENGVAAADTPSPVWVQVLRAAWPDGLEEEAARVAATVARVLDHPVENVHVLYLPPAAGRVAFGGKLRR